MTLRTTITLASFVIGLVLVALSFLSLPLTDGFRQYLLYAGVGLLLLGLVLAIARRPGEKAPAATEVAPTADVAVLEPAAAVAPPRAEVTIVVGRNGASEPSVRWYHAAAVTTNGVAARKARLIVAVRGEQVGAQWRWQAGERDLDLTQLGAGIPIVIGGVDESAEPTGSGWIVPFKNWYVTQNANSSLGPFLAPFIAGVGTSSRCP